MPSMQDAATSMQAAANRAEAFNRLDPAKRFNDTVTVTVKQDEN